MIAIVATLPSRDRFSFACTLEAMAMPGNALIIRSAKHHLQGSSVLTPENVSIVNWNRLNRRYVRDPGP